LDQAAWLLWGATVLWSLGFDTVYAMADREDDQRIGVNSSARFFGAFAPLAVGLCWVGSWLLLVWEGRLLALGWGFWLALIAVGLGWFWQFIQLRAPKVEPSLYGQIFRQNVWLGFVLLAGIIAGTLI
jgi:4-hydroxybenzoate polyprenyltransferase